MYKPSLFIFDMDGLLFDTERLFMNIRAEVLAEYGYVHRDEDYMKTIGTSGENLRAILRDIYGPDYPEAAISAESRSRQQDYIRKNGPGVKPGIRSLLEWAKKHAIPCCVASSTHANYVNEFLRLAGLDDFFSFVIGGDQVTRSKPDPEIFLLACEKADTPPSKALVLEDSENGVLAAVRGGIPVICIPDLKQPSEEIIQKAAAVVSNAEEVISWLSDK